ncbi:hypothetical protein HFN_0270 [Helicobacter fennelliae MRY12-0050]|uniref:Uncharacterized protein n=1 Tax=Helicobacter fennelliae MRY12-0050 TaxID=1325130 RepID=T1CQW6_9HELI|nr:hypothetical protein HFN_0270 [Helicobacter fennelliae MRY12-0050]
MRRNESSEQIHKIYQKSRIWVSWKLESKSQTMPFLPV